MGMAGAAGAGDAGDAARARGIHRRFYSMLQSRLDTGRSRRLPEPLTGSRFGTDGGTDRPATAAQAIFICTVGGEWYTAPMPPLSTRASSPWRLSRKAAAELRPPVSQ